MALTAEVEDPIANLLYGLKSSESKRQYPARFKMFVDFMNLKGTLTEQAQQLLKMIRENPQAVEDTLKRFIRNQIQRAARGEIAEVTISNYYKAVKLFCEMNRVALLLDWRILGRGLPRGRQAANDRAPTIDELRKLADYPDRRIKTIVFIMASSGIRLGAWDYLKWKHVEELKDAGGELIAAKLLVYPGDKEEYYTFITPEAFTALKEWIDFRTSYGERISGESWVMRDLWQTSNVTSRAKSGLATCPRKLKSTGIKRLLERALWEQGIRDVLPRNVKRHEWKAAHGMRKYYKSHAGHHIWISESYYKPTVREVLATLDYLRAVPLLSISADSSNIVLQKQVKELTEKSRDNEYIIKANLQDKENTIQEMKEKYDADIALLKDAILDMQQLLKNPTKLTELAQASKPEASR